MDTDPSSALHVSSPTATTSDLPGPSTPLVHEHVKNDVGAFVGQTIDDFTKYQLLENPWVPPPGYTLPHSVQANRHRYLRQQHLDTYKSWLVYSPAQKGLFCKYCPWFTSDSRGGANKATPLGNFVTRPLKLFKDLNDDLKAHANNTYHTEAVVAGLNFLHTYHNPEANVANQVITQRMKEVQENRQRLYPITETILFSGHNNIPLRGHRDDGSLLDTQEREQGVEGEGDVENKVRRKQGLFRELLKFRVSAGDKLLEEHLRTASSRATYISKTTQNELIRCCGDEVLDSILTRVRKAEYYAVLFDETTDGADLSQLSIVLRYHFEKETREDFVGFLNAFAELEEMRAEEQYDSDDEDWTGALRDHEADRRQFGGDGPEKELSLTGKALGRLVVRFIERKLHLPLENCVGVGTDGCSVMMSEERGAVAEIQKAAPNALKCPCSNHKLNNSLAQSNKVPVIKMAVALMKQTINFFGFPKREYVLVKHLGSKLSGMCETRWVERHDGVLQFTEDLPKILSALEEISNTWANTTTAGNAQNLRLSWENPQVLVSLMALADVLSLTKPLSVVLQKPSLDLQEGASKVADAIAVLQQRRENAEAHFHSLWNDAVDLAAKMDPDCPIELTIPRRCPKQLYRANYDTSSPETFYRLSTYIPLVDHVLMDLNQRFTAETLDIFSLPYLLPEQFLSVKPPIDSTPLETAAYLEQKDDTYLEVLHKRFGNLVGRGHSTSTSLRGEFAMWRQMWTRRKEKNTSIPTKVADVLEQCDGDIYPTVRRLLLVLVTLPVSNASAERSFSTLRRLKTWLRNKMGEERLNGLALLHMHQDIRVSIDAVIDRFARSGKRRLEFIL